MKTDKAAFGKFNCKNTPLPSPATDPVGRVYDFRPLTERMYISWSGEL